MSEDGSRDDTPTLEQPRVKRARTLSPVPRHRDEMLVASAAIDHTLHLAHAVFMQIFDLLPTRQLLSLAFVSRHWRRMQLSFFRSLGVIDLTDIVREQPAECEWPLVAAALDTALETKNLKPSYRERLAAKNGGTRLLHRLLVTDAVLIPMFPRCSSLRVLDLSFCEAVTDRTLIELAEHCKTIERVITVRCLRITGLGVNALLARLPNLRDLNCGWCPLVDDEIIDNDDETDRSLALENVQLSWTRVTLAGVFTLLQQCRKLRVLGYCFGRSPLFDTLITSSSRRWTDPPVEDVFDSRGRRVEVDLPLFPGCLPCRSPFCENVESVPFEYGVCAGCKSAMYCSKACQGVAWHFGHGNICTVREVATELKYQPFLAEGIVKCTNLRVVDASGNRALADVLLGCLLVHQERYLRGARKRRLERVAADEVAAAAAAAGVSTADLKDGSDVLTSPRSTTQSSPSSSSSSASESQETAAHLLDEGDGNEDATDDADRRSFSFHTQRAASRWLATMPLVPDEPVALRCLCVSKCMMSDDRIRVLAPVLAGLTHMDLEKNCLTDKGVFALAQAGRSLRHLQVTGARLSLATASLLCNSMSLRQSLRSLLIGGTGAMGPKEARMVVRACPNLRRLYVWSQMTDAEGHELQSWIDRMDGGARDLLVLAKARLVDAEGVQ